MKRDLSNIENEETSAKLKVEEALKMKSQYEEICKGLRNKIKRNREKFRN